MKKYLLLLILSVIAFSFFVLLNQRRLFLKKRRIADSRSVVWARTDYCRKNLRSSMHTLYYSFDYKGRRYAGSKDYSKSKLGDICSGFDVMVEVDSLDPSYNNTILDSVKFNFSK